MKGFVLAASMVLCSGVQAQQTDSGTYDVYFQEVSRQGFLTGCSMVFTALVADHIYKHGEQVILNGNIAFQTFDGKQIAFTAKLGTRPLQGDKSAREAPVHFHIGSGPFSTAGKAIFTNSDAPGYRLLITDADEDIAKLMANISATGQFKVGFNRKEGGMDLNTVIDTTAALRRGKNGEGERYTNKVTPVEFGDCVVRLVDDLQQRLSGRK